MPENCVFSPSGQFLDIFRTFFGHFVDVPFFWAVQRFARYKVTGYNSPQAFSTIFSGTNKEHKPKLLSPDVFRWGRGLAREGVGVKKFGMSLETQGNQTFWAGNPAVREKFEKKKVCVQFLAPIFLQLQLHDLMVCKLNMQ